MGQTTMLIDGYSRLSRDFANCISSRTMSITIRWSAEIRVTCPVLRILMVVLLIPPDKYMVA